LCQLKHYKDETMHLALNVFDIVLESGKIANLKKDLLPLLIVTSVILAAKIE
jgi:hypothetical protein